ncbi:methyltransferase domain-containing protein [Iamia sp. SCSIO 61187]|uniref:class I SAM-dependent methyltransferase n=1 Tax=Iamia sp. SCSIO 61187 TaxID=2722752 RepID=UPI001C63501D|nr:class I SAM-dependent methyltransferase [Iamia sp. SCSIO 61187]QYG93665.1 methyltransferase domain-containing protein [Iamia sp. SCSIO 61187]
MSTTTTDIPTTPTPEELAEATAERLAGELSSAAFVAMVALGDALGLYGALHRLGPSTAGAVAAETGCNERLVLEWLSSNAGAGYVTYDPDGEVFALAPGVDAVLVHEASPAFLAPGAEIIRSLYADQARVEAACRGDGGIDWGDHHTCMFTGVERFFATSYRSQLVEGWIPAVPGLEETLRGGARVADVGCGHGISTALMAAAYPASTFHGFDFHAPSLDRARAVAAESGVEATTSYELATAVGYGGGPYDVICFFDALHDMGDPEAAIRHAASEIAEDGVVLLVEPWAGPDRATSLQHPLAKWSYAASTVLCTPCALAQQGPLALGNQAGPARMEELFRANGFTRFEVALETPFNLVIAVRP